MKRAKRPRMYVDTSIFGGVFDPEFARASKRFFDKIDRGVFTPLEVIEDEDEVV